VHDGRAAASPAAPVRAGRTGSAAGVGISGLKNICEQIKVQLKKKKKITSQKDWEMAGWKPFRADYEMGCKPVTQFCADPVLF
jgi:hypothetical protein